MPPAMTEPTSLDRRRFLLAACAAGGVAVLGTAAPQARAQGPVAGVSRWIELANTHTAETLQLAYRDASGFIAPALDKMRWLLRDHRANEAGRMDAQLFDQLTALAEAAGVDPRFEVISAYRSPRTNAALRAAGRGVATRSLHMEGRAIDVRLHGVSCATLRDLAVRAAAGGVGYYRASNFVHLDTGRVRAWAG